MNRRLWTAVAAVTGGMVLVSRGPSLPDLTHLGATLSSWSASLRDGSRAAVAWLAPPLGHFDGAGWLLPVGVTALSLALLLAARRFRHRMPRPASGVVISTVPAAASPVRRREHVENQIERLRRHGAPIGEIAQRTGMAQDAIRFLHRGK